MTELHVRIIFNFYTGTVTRLISMYLYLYLNVHVIQCPSRFTLRAGFCGYLFTTFLKLSFTVVGGMEAGPDRVVWNEDMKNKEVQVRLKCHHSKIKWCCYGNKNLTACRSTVVCAPLKYANDQKYRVTYIRNLEV